MKKEVKEHPIIEKKIKKSLSSSIREGSYSAGMIGIANSYMTPYALALNATSSQIGFLNALLHLFPSLVQLKASQLIEKFSRKKITITFAFLQVLMLIPIIFMSALFFLKMPGVVWYLILFVALFHGFGAVAAPAWLSWMGSLVPDNRRGKYFAKRNRITGFFGLIAMIFGAIILDYSKQYGFVLMGFGLLFTIGLFLRIIAIRLLSKQYEPKVKVSKKDYFSLFQFLSKAPETPFGRFTITVFFLRITAGIAMPFFAVYMLKNLGLSYIWFMIITVSSSAFQLLFLPPLGKMSDKFGNVAVLRFCFIFIGFTPIMWMLSSSPVYLALIPAMISGIGWAGFNLATHNYVYDAVHQKKRSFAFAYFNLMNGMGIFIGSMIGSGIVLLKITFMEIILFIFLISAVGRLLVAIISMRYMKEVRHVSKLSTHFIMREFNPAHGITKEIHHLNHYMFNKKKSLKTPRR